MQPTHASKRPNGNRCSRSRLVSDVLCHSGSVIPKHFNGHPPLFSDGRSPASGQPKHSAVKGRPLQTYLPPRFESTSPDYGPCPSFDSVFDDVEAQCRAQALVEVAVVVFFVVVVVAYTDLLSC